MLKRGNSMHMNKYVTTRGSNLHLVSTDCLPDERVSRLFKCPRASVEKRTRTCTLACVATHIVTFYVFYEGCGNSRDQTNHFL